jgi:hypothetical protein
MTITELYNENFPSETMSPDEVFDNRVYKSIARLVGNLSITNNKEKI